ncbi:unnamed protein product [Zymoseptoria tritici ST99CH_1A5]|uniref:Major facilitator superfamily (MFS) profile domain-containing protein n=1 Tax=Zymoseptoria tritici ST99CH_1A5 TaxID=1276529 RepID=A0A1Y6LZU1_ZYMTR|nr:unnamed protein product [Zymoseptoria tritici ST99CH_3D1]SMY29129.1 unnamed protein product [Zymoseptoria tritici ST99CH_1A5]
MAPLTSTFPIEHAHENQHATSKGLEASEIERVVTPDDVQKDVQDYNRIDAEVARYTDTARIEISPAENLRLRKLINKRVLTIMVLTYFLQALDKGTLSFTSIMKLPEDLNLQKQQYSWLTTCIYIAILIVEYPINWLIQRLPIAKFLGACIVIWGSVLAFHAAATGFAGICALRTLLGIFEAVCQPTFLILSSMWYRREEQAMIVAFWYCMNGAQQIVGGLLAYCFSLIPRGGALESWQAIFITYGVVSVLWGVFVICWLPDSPMRAKCFSEEDKHLMVERVRSNQTGLQNKKFRVEQMKEAFLDLQCWCYCLIAFCTTLPTGGLGAFANIIITGFGFTVLETQLLAMVLGAFIIITLFSSSWLAKKTQQNTIVMACFCLPSFAGTIVLMTVEKTNTSTAAGLLFSYYIILSFWAAQSLGMSMLSRNVAGQTKKSVAVSMNFVAWATGNAIGPQVFLSWDAPRYFIAFSTHIGCYTLLIMTLFVLRWYLRSQNKKRDVIAAAGVPEAQDEKMVHAFEDLTDKENPNFRYVF